MMSKILQASDGRKIRAIEAGAGPILVLLHGVGLRAEAWSAQIAAFSPRMRVVALDMAGHGGSDPLPGTPGLPDYVAWAAGAIEALDAGPVAVAGHSMGALITLGLAVERPDLVARAAPLNAVFRRSPEARAAVLGRARDLAQGLGTPEAPLARWFVPGEAPEARAEVAQWLREVSPQGYAAAYAAFATGDATYADRLSSIRCPVLALTAEFDGNSTPEMTRQIAAAIPGARAAVIAGERHMAPMTAPEAVNRELAAWLGLAVPTPAREETR